MIRNSGLDYVILRPGMLLGEKEILLNSTFNNMKKYKLKVEQGDYGYG